MQIETIDLTQPRGLRLSALVRPAAGPTVLLAHAASMCAGVWEPIVAGLGDVTAVAVDLRGHGDSDAPAGSAAYRWEEIARDLAAVARWIESRFGRAIDLCVTHSFSGDCMLLACATEPLPVDRLVLLDPVAVDENGAATGGPSLAKATLAAAERESGGFDGPEAAAAAMERWIRPQLVGEHMDERSRAAFAAWGVFRGPDARYRFKCRRENEAEIYRNRLSIAAALQPLPVVPQPVEVVFAEKRRVRPGEDPDAVRARDEAQIDMILARCSSGRRETMPKVGHFLALEAPDAIASLVASRLGRR